MSRRRYASPLSCLYHATRYRGPFSGRRLSPGAFQGGKTVVEILGPGTASEPRLPDFLTLEARLAALANELGELALKYAQMQDSRAVCAFALGRMQSILADELRTAGFDDPSWPVELGEHLHRTF